MSGKGAVVVVVVVEVGVEVEVEAEVAVEVELTLLSPSVADGAALSRNDVFRPICEVAEVVEEVVVEAEEEDADMLRSLEAAAAVFLASS